MVVSKVLVIGGAGYVGSVATHRLLEQGHSVRVLDSLIWNNGQSLKLLADHPDFEFQLGDMRDRGDLSSSLIDVDAVVLLAGLVGDPITRKYPDQATDINLRGVRTALDQTLEMGTAHIIFASTCSNYGLASPGAPVDETAALNPLSLYAEHKVATEEYLLSLDSTQSTVTILRIATAFGVSPRMRLDLTVSHFVSDAIFDGRIEVFDADTWRPYCHVEDISLAINSVLEVRKGDPKTEVFNVGSNQNNFTKRMLSDLIQENVPTVQIVDQGIGSDARDYRVDFSRIETSLNFQTMRTLEDHVPLLVSGMQSGILGIDRVSRHTMGNYVLG